MTQVLFILNGAPYGDERTYNGLRLAGSLAKKPEHEVRAFLMGDAAPAAKDGQHVPPGFYNLQIMLNKVIRSGPGRVAVCGTCMDARGITDKELVEGAHRGTLEELTGWTEWADKVLVF
ncbi:MAG: DsrE family protein [Hydrogenophilales bacterium]|nr:DsrE family protein [Hydrogenophilales bacterium]